MRCRAMRHGRLAVQGLESGMVNHPNRAKPEATKLMRAAQKQNQFGKVEVTLTETGTFYARAYLPTHEVTARVTDHIRAHNLASLSLTEFGELADKLAKQAIAQGSGRTAEDALREMREKMAA
jgi:hypothetical protein